MKEPIYLAINGAETRLQIVFSNETELLFSKELLAPYQSVTLLTPFIAEGLKYLDLKTTDLAGIFCVRGPGSFTGLRISLATTHAIARAAQIPQGGLPYLNLIAKSFEALSEKIVWVLTYARKQFVYAQSFNVNSTIKPLSEIQVLAISDLEQYLPKENIILVGSGIEKNKEYLNTIFQPKDFANSSFFYPSASILGQISHNAIYSHKAVQPLYLRRSDAEELLPNIAKKMGITTEKAKQFIPDYLNQNL